MDILLSIRRDFALGVQADWNPKGEWGCSVHVGPVTLAVTNIRLLRWTLERMYTVRKRYIYTPGRSKNGGAK